MDNRFLIWMAVAMIWLLVYQAWQRDYHTPQPVTAEQDGTPSIPGDEAPPAALDAPPQLSDTSVPVPAENPVAAESQIPAGQTVSVRTDVFDLVINTLGANLQDVILLDYPRRKDTPNDKMVLLQPDAYNATALQTGLLASGGAPSPTHDVQFNTGQTDYQMSGDQPLEVKFQWSENGISVNKIYTFYPGRYNIDLKYQITNNSGSDWHAAQYAQLKGSGLEQKRSMVDVDSYSFVGPVFYDGDSYEKYKVKDLIKKPIDSTVTGGWLANIRHHFLSAAVLPADEQVVYQSRTPNNTTLVSGVAPLQTVANGSTQEISQQLFVGPKLQEQMDETAEGLKLSVDYGLLTIIAQPMFWLLNTIHKFVGNWGWSIIFLTILIKILFYPLAEKAGRSSAKMRTVAPRLKSIQERYKDDKQAQSKAMMELYKKEQINPAAGCLPLLIQMPVFLALYWVLIESVELRQAPFLGWIQDLSSRDPYFILPLIMAGAMFVQTKLNPKPPDPTMAKVMTFMPIVMSVFFMFFPAGLVLYWVVNTVLSVAQQWRINKIVGAAS